MGKKDHQTSISGRVVACRKFVICQGKVRVFRTQNGADQELAVLQDGSFFGEMALLSGEPRSADVTALDFCKFLTLNRRDFRRFLKKHPSMQQQILYRAAERNEVNRKQLEAALAETEPSVPSSENSFTKT